MTQTFPLIDTSDSALNVAVQGDKVLILVPGGVEIVLSLEDARRSHQRLTDAIAFAEGRVPALTKARVA
jgi:hypothetical protein